MTSGEKMKEINQKFLANMYNNTKLLFRNNDDCAGKLKKSRDIDQRHANPTSYFFYQCTNELYLLVATC